MPGETLLLRAEISSVPFTLSYMSYSNIHVFLEFSKKTVRSVIVGLLQRVTKLELEKNHRSKGVPLAYEKR